VTSFAHTGKPDAAIAPPWPQFNGNGAIMSLAPGGDSQPLPGNLMQAIHHCDFWDRVAPEP
jgi:para-nitrobenzyl esterase